MSTESSTREYAITSLRCALTVAALVSLLYGITTYPETFTNGLRAMALGIASGAEALDAFLMGLIKPVVTQVLELPGILKWMVCGVFLWSLCVSHKLKDKGGQGGFPKSVKYIRLCCGALIIGYLFSNSLNQDHPWITSVAMAFALIYFFALKALFRFINEADSRLMQSIREARLRAESELVQGQGTAQ